MSQENNLEKFKKAAEATKEIVDNVTEGIKNNTSAQDYLEKKSAENLPTVRDLAETTVYAAAKKAYESLDDLSIAATGKTLDGQEVPLIKRAIVAGKLASKVSPQSRTAKVAFFAAKNAHRLRPKK